MLHMLMRKVLIYTVMFATLLGGCSRLEERWVHRIEIQQGNVITQEMVDELQPGMNRQQVRYILGTPVLEDTFHNDRWTYLYTTQPAGKKRTQRELILVFNDDKLTQISGDMRPGGKSDQPARQNYVNVAVPDTPREDPGVLTRFWRYITFKRQREAAKEE